jgi:hypothetical protein
VAQLIAKGYGNLCALIMIIYLAIPAIILSQKKPYEKEMNTCIRLGFSTSNFAVLNTYADIEQVLREKKPFILR